jgi:HK97 gp10 family phage protein
MGLKTKLTTKGFEDYLERLAAAHADIDAICDEALAAGGEILLEGMQRRVPKDTHNLENHLSVSEPMQDGNFHSINIGLVGEVDAKTALYGNVQEFGSAHTPAQPYVRPTMDEDMGKARKAMRQVFKEKGAL